MQNNSVLPDSEIEFLFSLPTHLRNSRLAALHDVGWSLALLARSIGKAKTTVYFWVVNAIPDSDPTQIALPIPPQSPISSISGQSSVQIRSISPKVPPDLRIRLRELSRLARRYRARTPPSSNIAQANRDLTTLAVNLHTRGVPIANIAFYAEVSYRAMARRVASAQKIRDEVLRNDALTRV